MGEIAIIRTSDRISFKRCRRKWSWTSHLQLNRDTSEAASYLWLGTGCHYALQDFHGWNYYKSPVEAFRAYVHAQREWVKRNPHRKLPMAWTEQAELGEALMEYYLIWLQGRDPLQTYWHNGVPQCEVKCSIQLPFSNEHYDEVYYQATLDRVVIDSDGNLWVQDYKFYNRDWTPQPDFDAQMSAYIWIASLMYDRPVVGAILQKHFKKVPEPPRILASGKLSSDKNQNTSAPMYKERLIQMYGAVENAPLSNRQCYEALLLSEDIERDDFIRRDRTRRNENQIAATYAQIMMELPEMLNPELPLYKNDTKDCSWDCAFNDICQMMDQGLDWESTLLDTTVNRDAEDESWQQHLPHLASQ